jgi:hypothetical protein
MLSLSNRQSSTLTVSGWFGARAFERDLPPNRREMGNSVELGYSHPCPHQRHEAQYKEEKELAHRVALHSQLSLALV